MFIFGALADAVPALRKERAEFKPDERFLHVVNMIRTGQFGWADCESLLPGLGVRMSSPRPLARIGGDSMRCILLVACDVDVCSAGQHEARPDCNVITRGMKGSSWCVSPLQTSTH